MKQDPTHGIGEFHGSPVTLSGHIVHFTVWQENLPFSAVIWVDGLKRRIASSPLVL
jgi:hypothetical protein